jgi:D-alanine-D-alanine ligase
LSPNIDDGPASSRGAAATLSNKKRLRILLLLHEDLIPPPKLDGLSEEEVAVLKTEYDVETGLRSLGHSVLPLGLGDELGPLRKAIIEWKPHIAFNLLEEFRGQAVYDQNVVSYLELMCTPYTGCNPRGLVLARDKALSKKILAYHRIAAPRFFVFPIGSKRTRLPKHLEYPVIIKSLMEEASLGISQASVVRSQEKLLERVRFIHESIGTDAIAEEYIDGREIYVSLLGDRKLQVLPTWELDITGLPDAADRIATRRVKWDLAYQRRHGIVLRRAENLSPEIERRIAAVSKRIYRLLGLSGYARLDFRLAPDQKLYFIEANANPDIGRGEELSMAAAAAGLSYEDMLQKVVGIGLQRSKLL